MSSRPLLNFGGKILACETLSGRTRYPAWLSLQHMKLFWTDVTVERLTPLILPPTHLVFSQIQCFHYPPRLLDHRTASIVPLLALSRLSNPQPVSSQRRRHLDLARRQRLIRQQDSRRARQFFGHGHQSWSGTLPRLGGFCAHGPCDRALLRELLDV